MHQDRDIGHPVVAYNLDRDRCLVEPPDGLGLGLELGLELGVEPPDGAIEVIPVELWGERRIHVVLQRRVVALAAAGGARGAREQPSGEALCVEDVRFGRRRAVIQRVVSDACERACEHLLVYTQGGGWPPGC